MLTRNFLTAFGKSTNGLNLDNCPNAVLTTGESGFLYLGSGQTYCFSETSNWKNAKIILGTGTTKPKISDYCIESEITEGYDCSSPLWKKYIQGEEKDNLNIGGIITNTSVSNIEFSEIGVYVYINVNGGRYAMIAREVYDTPVTIAPGESVAVNVNIM